MLIRFVPLEKRLTETNIMNIQQQLYKLKLYTAQIHGIYDQYTKDAIMLFQESQHLPTTGIADGVTLCRLLQARETTIENSQKKERNITYLNRANILITKNSRQLTLFNGNTPLRQFPVAIGKPSTPTPVGNFAIATKIINPGGVLGSRWMGLNYDAYGIHGTNRPWLIGQMVSNGCIRMHNAHVEEVFALINIGTPVFIRD